MSDRVPHQRQRSLDSRRPRGALQIVHEDADLLVVDKPAGVLTASDGPVAAPTLFDQVKEHVREARRRRGQGRVWILHRLDREASGLLVFAKSERAFNWLKEDFRARRVHRLYLAVVEGEMRDRSGASDAGAAGATADANVGARGGTGTPPTGLPQGTIQSFIQDDPSGRARSVPMGEVALAEARDRGRGSAEGRRPTRSVGPPKTTRGGGTADVAGSEDETDYQPRLAVTHYRVLGVGRGRSLVQLRLETGRKNQVRVHMAEAGHPIVGDRRYGAASDPIGRVALHAAELRFNHPANGQSAAFRRPAPAGFYSMVGMKSPAEMNSGESRSAATGSPRLAGGARVAGGSGVGSEIKPTPQPPPSGRGSETAWEHVAEWYDRLIDEGEGDHYRDVILPGALRLLRPAAGQRVLDIACGQGVLGRLLNEHGVEVVGVDASPKLIEVAQRRTGKAAGDRDRTRATYVVGDARELGSLPADASATLFDAAACVMALMNINPLEPVFRGLAPLLKPGGAFVAVILHPAFRSPGQTSWGWDEEGTEAQRHRGTKGKKTAHKQYRRVDGYLSPGQTPITMNPGSAAHGAEAVTTWTFHRPIQAYAAALAEAGFLIDAIEEWPSRRVSQAGPRAAEENRARREIPMFLGLRALLVGESEKRE